MMRGITRLAVPAHIFTPVPTEGLRSLIKYRNDTVATDIQGGPIIIESAHYLPAGLAA